VLQALAAAGVLHTFDYLSTVSGGGYAGSWLTGQLSRASSRSVEHAVKADEKALVEHALEAGEKALRSNAPYLTMQRSESWDLAALFVRNLLVNWLALVPFVLGVVALYSAIAWRWRWTVPAVPGFVLVVSCLKEYVGSGEDDQRRMGTAFKWTVFLGSLFVIVEHGPRALDRWWGWAATGMVLRETGYRVRRTDACGSLLDRPGPGGKAARSTVYYLFDESKAKPDTSGSHRLQ
jgi:hypothetical protein